VTAAIPSAVPSELIAGDTWAWARDLSDYPASASWGSTIYFENAQGTFSVAATVSGSTHTFSVGAATTAGYRAGRYGWRLRVTDGTTVTTVESGFAEVKSNPATSTKNDTRSWARRTLDAVEAFLEGNATTAQASMSVQGRSISRWSLSELLAFQQNLEARVRAEEQGTKAGSGRDIKVRFSRA